MKIASIVGARPQFIKLAPVSLALRKRFDEIIIHTGQHYDREMSKLFFEELAIPKPDYNLGVGSGTQGYQTGEMLRKIEEVFLAEKPDMALVFGDTNSTIAGALAAAKLHIPIIHVEAGLRSFNRSMPEEVNRVLTDHCSDLLFAPTVTAVENLEKEGITKGVHNVGDVMYDALLRNKKIAAEHSTILDRLDLVPGSYSVLTIHRQSNTDIRKNLENILGAVLESGRDIVFPVHPRTRKIMENYGLGSKLVGSNIHLVGPQGYLDFLRLLNSAETILTDSGGVQKEAYLLGVPCITLRSETEWVETTWEGRNILVGANKEKILQALETPFPKSGVKDHFGRGDSAMRIANLLEVIG